MSGHLGDPIGQNIAHYVVERRIGGGAMASVYQAADQIFDRTIALKVLMPGADALTRQRFRQEARTVSILDHPNIVKTLQVGQTSADGVAYIAMDMVKGKSLSTLLDEQSTLSVGASCALLEPIARALAYAHSLGVIHRDVKPSNILLHKVDLSHDDAVPIYLSGKTYSPDDPNFCDAYAPFLSDFGIARALDSPELTSAGRTIGTPAYMAPEQCAGSREIDGRADIYSLGTVLYRCLVGRPPFIGTTTQILHAHVYEPLMIPDDILSELPPSVIEALRRSLMKEPEYRYKDASEMADALATVSDTYTGEFRAAIATGDQVDFDQELAPTRTVPLMESVEDSGSTSHVLIPGPLPSPVPGSTAAASTDGAANGEAKKNKTGTSTQAPVIIKTPGSTTHQRVVRPEPQLNRRPNWIGLALGATMLLLLAFIGTALYRNIVAQGTETAPLAVEQAGVEQATGQEPTPGTTEVTGLVATAESRADDEPAATADNESSGSGEAGDTSAGDTSAGNDDGSGADSSSDSGSNADDDAESGTEVTTGEAVAPVVAAPSPGNSSDPADGDSADNSAADNDAAESDPTDDDAANTSSGEIPGTDDGTAEAIVASGTTDAQATDEADVADPVNTADPDEVDPEPTEPEPTAEVTLTPELETWLEDAEYFFASREWFSALDYLKLLERSDRTFDTARVQNMLATTYMGLGNRQILNATDKGTINDSQLTSAISYYRKAIETDAQTPQLQQLVDSLESYVNANSGGSDSSKNLLSDAFAAYAGTLLSQRDSCGAMEQITASVRVKYDAERVDLQKQIGDGCPVLAGLILPEVSVVALSGQIVYSSASDSGNSAIWGVAPTIDAKATLLVPEGRNPAVSRDGNLVAFRSDGPEGIRGYDLSNTLQLPLGRFIQFTYNPEDSLFSSPSWGPSDQRIIFESTVSGDRVPRLYWANNNGTGDYRLIADGREPNWHPTDDLIVFKGADDTGNRPGLWLISSYGGSKRSLTENPGDTRPAWSPNGDAVVFMSNRRDGNWEIYAVDVESNDVVRLTDSPANDGLPAVSPDGQTVAFLSNRDGGLWNLYVVPLRGGSAEKLTAIEGGLPNWLEHSVQWVK